MKKILLLLMMLVLFVGCNNTNQNGGSSENGQNNEPDGISMSDEEVIEHTKSLITESEKIVSAFLNSDTEKDNEDTITYQVENERDKFEVEAARVVDKKFDTLENIYKTLESIYTEKAIFHEFKPYIYRNIANIDSAFGFVEKDGKIYATKDSQPGGLEYFTWDFENAKVVYKSKNKAILQMPVTFPDNEKDMGQIIISYVNNKWKLEDSSVSWAGLPFVEIKRYYEGDSILNSLDVAKTFAEVVLKETYDIDTEQYIMVFEPFTYFMKDLYTLDSQEEYVILNLYKEENNDLKLKYKAFLDIDKSVESIVRENDGTGVISLDYLHASHDNYDEGPLFGYSITDMNSIVYEYDGVFEMNFFDTKTISSDIGTFFTKDYDKLLFIIPKYYGTNVKIYNEENEMISLMDNAIQILQLDGKNYKVVVEYEGKMTEFETKDINPSYELKDGLKLDFEYPMGLG